MDSLRALTLCVRAVLQEEGDLAGALRLAAQGEARRRNAYRKVEEARIRVSLFLAGDRQAEHELWHHLHLQSPPPPPQARRGQARRQHRFISCASQEAGRLGGPIWWDSPRPADLVGWAKAGCPTAEKAGKKRKDPDAPDGEDAELEARAAQLRRTGGSAEAAALEATAAALRGEAAGDGGEPAEEGAGGTATPVQEDDGDITGDEK
ncbi:unnamed protein product [Prorocentrum cordatum]|uniref:Uncharacterized protein n=1 Tax=Prorocentrum cordatum TaxID=2364126 RepID=A0ABN9YEC2_9DINO|nr:unnamed protein product [Polarella glacialis]